MYMYSVYIICGLLLILHFLPAELPGHSQFVAVPIHTHNNLLTIGIYCSYNDIITLSSLSFALLPRCVPWWPSRRHCVATRLSTTWPRQHAPSCRTPLRSVRCWQTSTESTLPTSRYIYTPAYRLQFNLYCIMRMCVAGKGHWCHNVICYHSGVELNRTGYDM